MSDSIKPDYPQDTYKRNLIKLRTILADQGLKPNTNLEDMLFYMGYQKRIDALILMTEAIQQEEIEVDKKILDWWMDKLFRYLTIAMIKTLVSENSSFIETLKLFYKYDSSTTRSDFELRITQKLSGEDWETDEAKLAKAQLKLFWKLKAFANGEIKEL